MTLFLRRVSACFIIRCIKEIECTHIYDWINRRDLLTHIRKIALLEVGQLDDDLIPELL